MEWDKDTALKNSIKEEDERTKMALKTIDKLKEENVGSGLGNLVGGFVSIVVAMAVGSIVLERLSGSSQKKDEAEGL